MSKIKVHAWDILRMIPDEEIAKIAKDTKVDFCAKVLTGERLFYLLVFAFLSADHVSQRRLEAIFNNPTYKTLFNVALPEYLSEDIAMPAVVQELIKYDPEHNNLYVLDRGFCALKNYELVEDAKAKFVGRIKTNRKMQVIESLMTENTNTDLGKLELVDDLVVFLYDREKKDFSNTKYRVIKAKFKTPRDTTRPNNKGKVKRVENEVFFITNDFDMTPQEIAFCYKKRWDIEVYFKFLKQNLNFSHFLSTNENGIKVILYMTIITSMLVMIYKKENELGFSIAKFNFYLEMQEWVGALLVVINGGDLSKTPFRHVTIRSRIP